MSIDHAVGPDREQALLHRLVDRAPSMMAYWDADQRCRFANRAYQRWFGVSPESLIGTQIRDLLGPLYQLNLPYIEGALRGEPQEFERTIPDPAGGPPRHSLASYLPDVDGDTVRGFFVIVTDISEIKRAKLELEKSEAKFSGIISISSDAIISIDADQRITVFNQGAEAMFGYRREEVLGAPVETLIPARLRASHGEHVTAYIAAAATPAMGERLTSIVARRKDGEEFPAEASISKLDLGGRPLLTVVLRDVTERKRIEAEQTVLAEAGVVIASSLNYKRTLRAVAQVVVQHVAELCVIDMYEPDDSKLMRLTVAHSDPAMAEACEQLAAVPVDSRSVLARSALETGEPQVFEDITPAWRRSFVSNEEHQRMLEIFSPRSAVVVPLLASNRVLGAIVFASSRPRRFGARDLRLASELARRAAIAIENAQLFEAAQRATQARDDVLGIVAHDVRAPLNAIQLAAKTLERQSAVMTHPRARQAVEMVMASVQRANRLIADLLDLSRIDGGALSVERGVVAVDDVIAHALHTHELAAADTSIELRQEIAADVRAVLGDHDRILQVLENLVGNALKFTPPGGRISVRAATSGDEVVFSVADTGVGIAPENLHHIFDRYWQAERARRDGAGLGLAICKGLVEAQGGRIWAESARGQGTTFFFTAPVAPVDQPDDGAGREQSAQLG